MIVVIANSKGGVGKSTIAVHLAGWLARQGYRVTLADCDTQASSSMWMAEANPQLRTVRLGSPDEILNQLPVLHAETDYAVTVADDTIVFRNRGSIPKHEPPPVFVRLLDPETYHDARTVAPGWDVYELEREWREWMTDPPRHPDAAFIGFCKKWHAKRGDPRSR